MSVTLRWSGAVLLALAVSAPVQAQNGNGNGGVRPPAVMNGPAANGFSGGAGVLGGAAPAINAMMQGGSGGASPYALSTTGSFNPYMVPSAAMSGANQMNPYSLSTYPGNYPYPPYTNPYSAGIGYGSVLQGFASTVAATGQYEKDLQMAKIIREKARQESLETARKSLQFQWWYENQMLLSNSRRRDMEMALDLDRARKDPPESEIYSAGALNTLLRSINTVGKLSRGPNVSLEEEVLRNVNLSGGTSPGNIGMLKDAWKADWKPEWPEGLLAEGLEETRASMVKNLRSAVNTLKDKAELTQAMKNDIRGAYNALLQKLNETDGDLTPSQSIDSRRFMNQLSSAIKALSDPKAVNYFNNNWNAKGKNVAELVDHMNREGLRFAPAAQGDEAAYRALYQALRSFEAGLQLASQR